MRFVIPVDSMNQNKGGVILYDFNENRILKQYVHNKEWDRVGWRGGILYNNRYLIATDWNEIHYFDIKEWKYLRSFTKNTFNDLHYLYIYDNRLYVVNTGIDAIEVFKDPLNPVFEELIFVFEQHNKFTNRDIDLNYNYNQLLKVKPHTCHPNCVFVNRNLFFVTCFEDETREEGTGCVIDINTGKIIVNNINCHDGIISNGNLYLSRTRSSEIIIIRNINSKKWPVNRNDINSIKIKQNGWWRGMSIYHGNIYLFASYGYGKTGTCKAIKVNLRSKKIRYKTLPVVDGYKWNAIYQPNLIFENNLNS